MKFKHQISITAETGVGSSSLLRALKARLDGQPYRWVSAGSLMREKAESLGMSIEQFAEHNWQYPDEGHDRWLDEQIQAMAQSDWMICEGRLPHFFMPEAFKVMLTCSLEIRAKRRFSDIPDVPIIKVMRDITDRDRNDQDRYAQLYPGCLWKARQFDLVLDTGKDGDPNSLADLLLEKHQLWVAGVPLTT